MAHLSRIGWADFTYNPWSGCTPVSVGCDNCFSKKIAARMVAKNIPYGTWGNPGQRVVGSYHTLNEPLEMRRIACRARERKLVLCGTMLDFFEDWPGILRGGDGGAATSSPGILMTLDDLRNKAYGMALETSQSLDWIFMTKHPKNIHRMVPEAWRIYSRYPDSIMMAASAENQSRADQRFSTLCLLPCRRVLVLEPILEPIDISPWLFGDAKADWVVIGGERGEQARPIKLDWFYQVTAQCRKAEVPCWITRLGFDVKDWSEVDYLDWPVDLQVRERPPLRPLV